MYIGKPQKVVPYRRQLLPFCRCRCWGVMVKLPVRKPLMIVRADDRDIAVVLLPGDVMQLECRGVRLSAGNAAWMLRSEAPKSLLPAVLCIFLLSRRHGWLTYLK
jgi:hypothetical protein